MVGAYGYCFGSFFDSRSLFSPMVFHRKIVAYVFQQAFFIFFCVLWDGYQKCVTKQGTFVGFVRHAEERLRYDSENEVKGRIRKMKKKPVDWAIS